jgi:hypothetical protein
MIKSWQQWLWFAKSLSSSLDFCTDACHESHMLLVCAQKLQHDVPFMLLLHRGSEARQIRGRIERVGLQPFLEIKRKSIEGGIG